ncbi:MAG TPA: protein kinase [Thermoanaerobaculia bacterium]|nr:protein kinase [Thermoanaerobaculia bacterium]
MRVTPGTRMGRYEIRSLLGSGGMGEVYRAYDHDLDREVAVKVLHAAGEDAERLRRFVQEARAASALHHPNVAHVYEIGSHEDVRFIAMEIVEGETLRHRIHRGPLAVDEVIDIGTQTAGALAAAHKSGIVHRDIKPENVIITPEGHVKVLDFGLAKLRQVRGEHSATMLKTATGVAMGTLGYMAPEQFFDSDVTPAADVFSLGVVLYEMVAGKRPFEAGEDPRDLITVRPEVPPKLAALIARSLARDPAQRPHDASVVHEEMRQISRAVTVLPPATTPRRLPVTAAAIFGVALLVAIGGWLLWERGRKREALRQVDLAETLLKDRKLAEAYEVAAAAATVLPDHERLRDIIPQAAGRLTIESDPAGATVFLQRFKGPDQRVRMGDTPLTIPRVPRTDYLLTFEKPGYAPLTRSLSLTPFYHAGDALFDDAHAVRVRLVEAAKVPPGMVLVEGKAYRLSGFQRPSDRPVELRDFFIDEHEVTNAEYGEFIRDGGYRRAEFWKHPFVDGGRTLTFDEAMTRFRDTTGLSGPRRWSGGAPPAGQQDHPVTDVTWYEAAAFAEWKGKKLPTVYQWERAARYPVEETAASSFPWGNYSEGIDVSERANFLGKGTLPANALPFGVSGWGAKHMAGNVAEWCRNEMPPGFAVRGGAWNDAVYAFGQTGGFPGFYAAPTVGFRCAAGGGGDEGDFALSRTNFVPVLKPTDDATYQQYRARYEYANTPLQARIVETIDAPDWTREKIHYVVAGKTVPAYLYLPKRIARPLQVIHFAPAADVTAGYRTLPQSLEAQLAPLVRGGRAVFAVEQEGFLGRPRPPGWVRPSVTEEEWVDVNVARVVEFRRGLDYLETRPDIDQTKIAFLGISAGGGPGVFVTALEPRYRSVIFAGTGISHRDVSTVAPANRIHFVPRIRAPKMMLQGKYDEDTSLTSAAEPMFKLMIEPKRLVVYEGGHMPPQEIAVPAFMKWLDETMGPPR